MVTYRNSIRRNTNRNSISDNTSLSKSLSNYHKQSPNNYLNPHILRFNNTSPRHPNLPLTVR